MSFQLLLMKNFPAALEVSKHQCTQPKLQLQLLSTPEL